MVCPPHDTDMIHLHVQGGNLLGSFVSQPSKMTKTIRAKFLAKTYFWRLNGGLNGLEKRRRGAKRDYTDFESGPNSKNARITLWTFFQTTAVQHLSLYCRGIQ